MGFKNNSLLESVLSSHNEVSGLVQKQQGMVVSLGYQMAKVLKAEATSMRLMVVSGTTKDGDWKEAHTSTLPTMFMLQRSIIAQKLESRFQVDGTPDKAHPACAEDADRLCTTPCSTVVCAANQVAVPCRLPHDARCEPAFPALAARTGYAHGEVNLLNELDDMKHRRFASFENALVALGDTAYEYQCVWNADGIFDNRASPAGSSNVIWRPGRSRQLDARLHVPRAAHLRATSAVCLAEHNTRVGGAGDDKKEQSLAAGSEQPTYAQATPRSAGNRGRDRAQRPPAARGHVAADAARELRGGGRFAARHWARRRRHRQHCRDARIPLLLKRKYRLT